MQSVAIGLTTWWSLWPGQSSFNPANNSVLISQVSTTDRHTMDDECWSGNNLCYFLVFYLFEDTSTTLLVQFHFGTWRFINPTIYAILGLRPCENSASPVDNKNNIRSRRLIYWCRCRLVSYMSAGQTGSAVVRSAGDPSRASSASLTDRNKISVPS